jgi:hypothetical protein
VHCSKQLIIEDFERFFGLIQSSTMNIADTNVFYRVTAHDRETDHPRVVFIDPNDLS